MVTLSHFDPSGHDVNIVPGGMKPAALRREGYAFGRYVARLSLHYISAASMDGRSLSVEASDEIEAKVFRFWRGTMDIVRPHLSEPEMKIFESAAHEARATMNQQIVKGLLHDESGAGK